ncbi:MAG: sugar transferase [Candidatus Saccharibacteria bacterium]|nr:sugar transferase [Candidatus Saccharibacteria bacterium]
MKNNASLAYSFLLIIADAVAITGAFSAAYILRVRWDPRPLIEQIPAFSFLYAFLAILPLWLLVHAFIGLYNQNVYEKRFTEIGRLLIGSFLGILVIIGYDFVLEGEFFPARLVAVYGLVLSFGFLLVIRSLMRMFRRLLFKYGIGISNVLIIGNTASSEHIADTINDTRHSGMRVLGIVGRKASGIAYFSSFEEAIEALPELPHGLIQTELYKNQNKNNKIMAFAQQNHITYRFVPGNTDLFVGNITVDLFADLPMIAVHQTQIVGWGRIAKRLFDVFASIMLIIITSPLMLLSLISLLIFDPKGGFIFRQTRLTRFNREFTCYKLRTHKQKYSGMSPEKAFKVMGKPELIKIYRENGDYIPSDPRTSAFGRFMRRASLDELPQLFNVLRGDISLVGPRALVPQELNTYAKKHDILSVKAGLTGLAQISGRRNISFEERRKIDMYYVQNWSFWLDISIILRTLRAVLTSSGAK